jgi:mannose-6-phosphate isomerase-like protein (cupin superfamily)
VTSSTEGAVWSLADALAAHQAAGGAYHQFFTVPEMSAGIYTLPAGAVDGQAPHIEDEIYYIISGKAQVQIADRHYPVETGATIFVAREVEHRFHNIEEDLTILVFFAPAHDVAESDRRREQLAGDPTA